MKTNLHFVKLFSVLVLFSADLSAQDYAFQWGKPIDGSYLTGTYKVVETANADLVMAANFRDTVDADISNGVQEFTVTVGTHNPFITRITGDGGFLWAIHISGQAFVNQLVLDDDENIYIAGEFEGTVDFDAGVDINEVVSQGSKDCYVAKYSPSGELIWVKVFGALQIQTIEDMSLDNDGNPILIGNFENTVDFDPNAGIAEMTPLVSSTSDDVFVVKWTGEGDFAWAKQLGGIGSQSCYAMALDQQQNILITGYFTNVMDCDPDAGEFLLTPVGSNFTAFVVKLTSDAEFAWAQQIGDGSQDIGIDIQTDNSNNIYCSGHFDGTADFDGGVGITELTAYGSRDVFTSKLSPDGTFLWVSRLGGTDTEHPTDMAIDADGNVYTTGFFQLTCDFDPSADAQNITAHGDYDGFISVLNSDGEYLWAAGLGNNFYDAGISITVSDEFIYQLGVFAYGCYLDPENPSDISVTGSQYSHGYIAKYAHPALGVDVTENIHGLTVAFPNPAQDFLLINGITSPATIRLTDMTGRTVLKMNTTSNAQLDLRSLPEGVYVTHIVMGAIMETKKIVIQ